MQPTVLELPPDFGARIRAAAAFANLSLEDFACRLNVAGASYSTLRKYVEQEKRPRPLARAELVRRLAEASGLPESFFLAAEANANGSADLADRVSRLEGQLRLARDEAKARATTAEARVLEVIRLLDERLPPSEEVRRRPPP